ncbi:MAG: SPOR domain-containing protein [Burkholderiaceae bacterium]|nr:SPOR domain-containing protein [Burkholderiaceae bacterium]
MKETDRYANYETMGKHLPEEAPVTETLHPREEIVTLRAKHHAKIRHRVIGGLILVLTGIALGPMLFDEAPPLRSADVKTEIPPIAKESLNKIYIPVEAALSDVQPGTAPASGLGLSQLDQRQDLSKVKPTDVSPQSAPQDVNVEKPMAADENGSYFIQVLATSSEAGAMKAMSRFQALGFPVHSVRVQKKSATLWRVRLGHFKTRVQAEEALVYLDRRKIPHLSIQQEKGATKPIAPKVPQVKTEGDKSVTKTEVKSVPQAKVASKPVARIEAKKVESVKSESVKPVVKKTVKTEAKPVVKSTVKQAEKVKPKASSNTTQAKSVVTKSAKNSDDPLAATLKAAQAQDKSTSSDFIAEQIARDRKK